MSAREEKEAHLVKLRSKQVEAGDDAAVGSQLVLLHDLLVVDGVPDVNVSGVGHLPARRVQIYHVGLACSATVQFSSEPLDKGGLSGAGHAEDNNARGQVFLFTAVRGR